MGWPKLVPRMLEKSWSMTAAMTIRMTKPRPQASPMAETMPRGTALAALEASSLMCTVESKEPMVQSGDSQASIKAQPWGHVVRFSSWVKMKAPLLRFADGVATGSAMMVPRMSVRFSTTATLCSLPMILASVEARTPCDRTMQR
jgi:hypothetical protein